MRCYNICDLGLARSSDVDAMHTSQNQKSQMTVRPSAVAGSGTPARATRCGARSTRISHRPAATRPAAAHARSSRRMRVSCTGSGGGVGLRARRRVPLRRRCARRPVAFRRLRRRVDLAPGRMADAARDGGGRGPARRVDCGRIRRDRRVSGRRTGVSTHWKCSCRSSHACCPACRSCRWSWGIRRVKRRSRSATRLDAPWRPSALGRRGHPARRQQRSVALRRCGDRGGARRRGAAARRALDATA